jgi:hydrogenase-4 component E
MNEGLQWVLVAMGLLVVLVRRRSVAILLVALQAVLLGVGALALAPHRPPAFLIAALILLARGAPLFYLLAMSVRRTREPRPLGLRARPLLNAGAAVAICLGTLALIPPLGLETTTAEHASVSLVVIGIITIVTRRETIFQALGLLIVENGVALAAVGVPGGLPLVVELGIAIDLTVVIAVAVILHERIFEEFGTGDSHVLRSLRD